MEQSEGGPDRGGIDRVAVEGYGLFWNSKVTKRWQLAFREGDDVKLELCDKTGVESDCLCKLLLFPNDFLLDDGVLSSGREGTAVYNLPALLMRFQEVLREVEQYGDSR